MHYPKVPFYLLLVNAALLNSRFMNRYFFMAPHYVFGDVGLRILPVSVQCSELLTCCAVLWPSKEMWDHVAICSHERPL